jgi:hypothetical protein
MTAWYIVPDFPRKFTDIIPTFSRTPWYIIPEYPRNYSSIFKRSLI